MRWRSVLITPATRTDRVARIAETAADVTVLDLEDGVAVADKERARASLRELAEAVPVFVRVNAIGSPWFAADAAEAVRAGARGLVVPKVERVEDAEAIRRVSATLPVLGGIETAAGVQRVARILATGAFTAVYFGAEDLVTDLGGVRTSDGMEVLYARSRVVLAARVAGVPAVDQVVVSYRDDRAFLRDARKGRALGYAGKVCVHPRQVGLAHDIFTPSAAELDRAERLLAAAEAAGGGVAVFEGQMIDAPAVRRARDVLDYTI